MREMILAIPSYCGLFVTKETSKRLPEKYKRDSDGRVYLDYCMDPEVIAIARETRTRFNTTGFKIISWDETKVMPVIFEEEYGDEYIYFVPVKEANDREYENIFIGTGKSAYDMMFDILDEYENYDDSEEYVTLRITGYEEEDSDETEINSDNFKQDLLKNFVPLITMSKGNSWTSCSRVD